MRKKDKIRIKVCEIEWDSEGLPKEVEIETAVADLIPFGAAVETATKGEYRLEEMSLVLFISGFLEDNRYGCGVRSFGYELA